MPIPCAHPQYDFWWTLLQYYSPRLSLSWTFKDLCRGRFNPLSFPICLVHIIACQGAFVTWGTLTFAQSHAIFIYSITYQPLNVTTSGKTHYLHSSLDACFQIIIIIVDLYNSNWKSHHKHWALQSASLCVCELCTVERPGIFPISLVFRHQPFSFVLYWCVCTSSAIFAYVCGHECECECERGHFVHVLQCVLQCADMSMLESVCVCSFMCACPLGSTGVLSGNTKPTPPLSDLAGAVSLSQQLAATSAVQHGGKKKKISTSDFFCSVPAGRHHVDLAMLAPSPWNQAVALAAAPSTSNTHIRHTHLSSRTTTAWPWRWLLWR